VKHLFLAALDFLIPRTCIVCGRELGLKEKHLCLYCQADLPLTRNWEMPHNPMADQFNAVVEKLHPVLESSPKPLEPYAFAASLLYYRGDSPYSSIPQALKYGGNIPAGRYFSALLGSKMAEQPHWKNVDIVIPVPLHWKRKRSRGYNQAEVIAAELAAQLGASLRTDILKRSRRTRSQTSLSAEERIRNVQGVFSVSSRKNIPPVRHVLLVDDTFTTGATLAACHRVLRNALGPDVLISIATIAMVSS